MLDIRSTSTNEQPPKCLTGFIAEVAVEGAVLNAAANGKKACRPRWTKTYQVHPDLLHFLSESVGPTLIVQWIHDSNCGHPTVELPELNQLFAVAASTCGDGVGAHSAETFSLKSESRAPGKAMGCLAIDEAANMLTTTP